MIFGLMSLILVAHAENNKSDEQMRPVLEEYLKIPKALSADTTNGVIQAAKRIEQLTQMLDFSTVTGEFTIELKTIPQKLSAAAARLKSAKGLTEMREALKELSKPMALWATLSKPKGVSVMYCSMARGSWLQRSTTVTNPYYGAKMLRCGEIVAGVGVEK